MMLELGAFCRLVGFIWFLHAIVLLCLCIENVYDSTIIDAGTKELQIFIGVILGVCMLMTLKLW